MTVTDPDVPDPLTDPRTLQADPGALGQGEDLASGEDDAVATGACVQAVLWGVMPIFEVRRARQSRCRYPRCGRIRCP